MRNHEFHDTGRALSGIQNLLDDYLHLQGGDILILCYQEALRTPAAWLLAAVAAANGDYLSYRFSHRDDAVFEADIRQLLRQVHLQPRAGRIKIVVAEGSTLTFTLPLKRLMREPGVDVLRLMNFGQDLFELGLKESKNSLKQINAGLLHTLMDATQLQIQSPLGTQLDVVLDSTVYQWVSNHGSPGPGELMVLPAGEVNTYPARINGQFVAEGALHTNVNTALDVRLQHNPITFRIQDNEVQTWQCENRQIMQFLDFLFSRPFGRRVGELGIGSNVGIDRFTAYNSHINERYPGVHLGFGEHTQPGRVAYQAECHADAISSSGTITVGSQVIDVQRLRPSPLPHPQGTRCEDIEHVPS